MLTWVDWIVVAIYMSCVFGVAIIAIIKNRKQTQINSDSSFSSNSQETHVHKNNKENFITDKNSSYIKIENESIPIQDDSNSSTNLQNSNNNNNNNNNNHNNNNSYNNEKQNNFISEEENLNNENNQPYDTTNQENVTIENNNDIQDETRRFFLAGGTIPWWAVACSLFASNIGSEHFIGLAGSGARDGMCVSMGEWGSTLCLLLLAWVFLPAYIRESIYTMPQFIEKRYNRACRQFLSVLSLLIYILAKISAALYAGSVVLRVAAGWSNTYLSATILTIATGTYTIIGGLHAVIYTEVVQTVVLIIGGGILAIVGLVQVGGIHGLVTAIHENPISDPSTHQRYFHLFQPTDHPDFPWTGVVFGLPWSALWYWCADQVIVQRALAGGPRHNARVGGCIGAGYMKISPVFIMVLPGMLAAALVPTAVKQDPDTAFVRLVEAILPQGLVGLLVAAMLAALMSSLASVFHSTATLFTLDIYPLIRRFLFRIFFAGTRRRNLIDSDSNTTLTQDELENHSESNTESIRSSNSILHFEEEPGDRERVIVGRIAAGVAVVLGVLWVPLVELLSGQLYVYTHKVFAALAPPVAIVFVIGIAWGGATSIAAFTTLCGGVFVGLTRLTGEMILSSWEKNSNPSSIHPILRILFLSNFLHFSAIFAAICIAWMFICSIVPQLSIILFNSRNENATVHGKWNQIKRHFMKVPWRNVNDGIEPNQDMVGYASTEIGSANNHDLSTQNIDETRDDVNHSFIPSENPKSQNPIDSIGSSIKHGRANYTQSKWGKRGNAVLSFILIAVMTALFIIFG